MSQRVRGAESSDRPALVGMMEEFYAEAGTAFDPARTAVAFDEILREDTLGRVWILERDGAIAGYAVLTFGFSLEYGGRDAFVDDLFVRTAHRGRGLGRAAMDELFEECRKRHVRALHLEVARTNLSAKELYRRFGFTDRAHHLMTAIIDTHEPDG